MNTLVTIKVLLIFAASAASQEYETTDQPQQKVEVTVYYEALCPDSIKFFKEQLTPHLDIIDKYVQLKHVPFGRATHTLGVNGVWSHTCRHTIRECEGHQVQACALLQDRVPATLKNAFISCLMQKGDRNKPYPTEECATETNFKSDDVAYQHLNTCLVQEQYDLKIEEFKTETSVLNPPLRNVPTIVFNGAYEQKDQNLALTDFKQVLCDYIQADSVVAPECADKSHADNHDPEANAQPQQKVEVTVYYEALCPDSIKFFKEQLTPHLDIIDKYVQLKHVPFGRATHTLGDNGVWSHTCRHTSTECEGHQVQACALLQDRVPATPKNAFISCLMQKGDRNKPYPTEECAREVNFTSDAANYQAVQTCLAQKQYDNKIEEFKTLTNTLNPPLKNVPTIVFNGVFKQSDQNMALKDFAKVLCHYIEVNSKDRPECQSHRNAADSQVVSTLLLTAVAALTIGNF